MLNTPAPFPHVGSTGWLAQCDLERGASMAEPEPCRILRLHLARQGLPATALIALTGRTYPGEIASGNRTVALAELHPTRDQALTAQLVSSRKRKSRSSAAEKSAA